MITLGINAAFHDSAATLVTDGVVVAAAEEERFTRIKHGKRPVPFSAWELPELAMRWCLAEAGLRPTDLDAVAYSFDPALCAPADELGLADPWDHLRQEYARRAPAFLAEAKRQDLDVRPVSGPEADTLVKEAYATPPGIVKLAIEYMKDTP